MASSMDDRGLGGSHANGYVLSRGLFSISCYAGYGGETPNVS